MIRGIKRGQRTRISLPSMANEEKKLLPNNFIGQKEKMVNNTKG
jgi:hypothetical protein